MQWILTQILNEFLVHYTNKTEYWLLEHFLKRETGGPCPIKNFDRTQ